MLRRAAAHLSQTNPRLRGSPERPFDSSCTTIGASISSAELLPAICDVATFFDR